ncbi:MAG: phage/plasmid primase, P4 family, partial [Actinomycetota bacterium]|nr:phage/plasmid primase, P4 family [Actinomycetota bacterium]
VTGGGSVPDRHLHAVNLPTNGGPGGSGGGSGSGGGGAASPASPKLHRTDLGNARRLIAKHGDDLRYCYERKAWLYYDTQRWQWDKTGEVERRAKDIVNVILDEAKSAIDSDERKDIVNWALKTEDQSKIRAMIDSARSEPGVAVALSDLDPDPWLLNCANGTLELKTGTLREHRRDDLITRLAPVEYDPQATAPTFEKFLARIQPDGEIRGWLQEYAGYSLTGDTSERVLAILHGNQGKNGKSTLVETLRKVTGAENGYALNTPVETLMAKPAGGIPNDVARLAGARLVSAAETEKGRRLAEGLVKQMTGGSDTMSARFMQAEWFDFVPSHKIWLSTNHRPTIKGTDHAIWDRIRLVPFEERIPKHEQDKQLPKKLEAELAGILAWAVEGCARWQRQGLSEPVAIMAATDEYRQEMDVLGDFVADCCSIHSRAEVGASALYDAYKEWCAATGEDHITQKSFGAELKDRGFDNSKRISSGPDKGKRKWSGIGILSTEDDPSGGGGSGSGERGETVNHREVAVNHRVSETAPDSNKNNTKTGENGPSMVHSEGFSRPMVHSTNEQQNHAFSTPEETLGERSEPKTEVFQASSGTHEMTPKHGSLHSLGSPEDEKEATNYTPELQSSDAPPEEDDTDIDTLMAQARELEEEERRNREGRS